MNYLDTIRAKRHEAKESREKSRLHHEQTETVERSGKDLVATIAQQHAKDRLLSSQKQKVDIDNLPDLALREDIQKVVTELEAIKNNRPEDVDITPLTNAINSLGGKLDLLPKSFPELKIPKSFEVTNLPDFEKALQPLIEAVNSKDYNPTISPNIKFTPPVVEIPKIDTTGIEEALRQKETEREIELSDFMAQDLDDAGAFQYVGFMRPDGMWYVIENDIDNNSLRYHFGKNGYAKAWQGHVNLAYKLLSEAVNEI